MEVRGYAAPVSCPRVANRGDTARETDPPDRLPRQRCEGLLSQRGTKEGIVGAELEHSCKGAGTAAVATDLEGDQSP